MPKISIIVRSKNDVIYIKNTLEKILHQNLQGFKILNFDNASTDGTKEIIAKYENILSFSILKGTYIPGKVLNHAFEQSFAEIIVFNNSDSIPVNEFWLENLIAPLLTGEAQATYARQLPRPDAFPWVKRDYARAFADKPLSDTFFSLVSAATTREVLERFPFDSQISYSEDVYWAKTLRDNGLKIAYTPNSIVEHSHNYTIEQVKRRFYGEGYADGEIWKKRQPYSAYIKGVAGGMLRDFLWLLKSNQVTQLFPCLRYRLVQKSSYRKGLKSYFKENQI